MDGFLEPYKYVDGTARGVGVPRCITYVVLVYFPKSGWFWVYC